MVSKRDKKVIASLYMKYDQEYHETKSPKSKTAIQYQICGLQDVCDALEISFDEIRRLQSIESNTKKVKE